MTTTTDRLLGGRLVLRQPAKGFRVAVDSVLLAAAVDAGEAARVLDAGCGTGAAALCLAARRPDLRISGLDLDPESVALARDNIALNGLQRQISAHQGELSRPPETITHEPFDLVMSNPPFNTASGPGSAVRGRHMAMQETMTAAAWLDACLARLPRRGRLVLVHRADRLPGLLAALDGKAGAIEIIPLWPKADGRPAKRVVLRCRKAARGAARLCPGLVLHHETGMFTDEADAVLRLGASLDDVLRPIRPAGG